MDWPTLLCTTRVRELFAGDDGASLRARDEARTEFERDFGRTVFSAPFRRLQDKAQVFPLEPNDSVRTRLTHSLEVSSVAKGIASTICSKLVGESKLTRDQSASISTIAATCGLLHDLGNPPFGHAGEVAIRDWFSDRLNNDPVFRDYFERMDPDLGQESSFCKDFINFDGNAQTLRLVSKLQLVSDPFGMNLTCGTMSAVCKYASGSNEIDKDDSRRKKTGFFTSERELVEKVREKTNIIDSRNPITLIVEAADDICYAAVDLEDGIKKGVITWEQCKTELSSTLTDDPHLEEVLHNTEKKVLGGELQPTGNDLSEAMSQIFRTFLINASAPAVAQTFLARYDSIMNDEYAGELISDSTASNIISACKKLAKTHVFPTTEVLKLEVAGRRIVQDLLDEFWFAAEQYRPNRSNAEFEKKVYMIMSPNYRNIFEREQVRNELNDRYSRLQLVTDYICGMTDTFAQTIHSELRNA